MYYIINFRVILLALELDHLQLMKARITSTWKHLHQE